MTDTGGEKRAMIKKEKIGLEKKMKIVHLIFKLEAETFPIDFGKIFFCLFLFYVVVELIYNVR